MKILHSVRKKTILSYLALFIFVLLSLTEAFKYEGFLRKHLSIPFPIIFIFYLTSISILLYSAKNKAKNFLKINLLLAIFFLISALSGSILNLFFNSPNFFYSKLHLNPKILLKNGFYFLFSTIYFTALFIDPKTAAASTLFSYSLLLFLSTLLKYTLSNFEINPFDGAISTIIHFYTRLGLTPYKDFGFFYPPGRILFLGKIIPFTSLWQRNLLFSLTTVFILFFYLYYLLKLSKKIEASTTISLTIFFLISTIILGDVPYEPFSLPLINLLFLTGIVYLTNPNQKQKSIITFLNFFLPILIWFIRWFPAFSLLLFDSLILAILFVSKKIFKKNLTYLNEFKKLFLIRLLGNLTGIILLLLYLLKINALSDGIGFIFRYAFIVLKYRKIPLPSPTSIFDPAMLIYSTLTALILLIFSFKIKNETFWKKETFLYFYTLLFPLIYLNYALGRSDWPHFLPLFISLQFSILLLTSIFPAKKSLLFTASLFASIPILTLLSFPREILPQKTNLLEKSIQNYIADCQEKISRLNIKYKSLFVTRKTYRNYTNVSYVVLYFINPSVPPATSFIHDEPGIHTSCLYGEKIVNQLKNAPKPILVLEQEVPVKKDETKVKTCGKIENWLKTEKHKDLTTCQVNGETFYIKLYQ